MKSPTYISLVSICLILAVSFGTGCSSTPDLAKSGAESESYYIPTGVRDGDGNTYRTVQIGNQVWMAENLRTSVFANGEKIPFSFSESDWTNSENRAMWCIYENDLKHEKAHGGLYNFLAVADQRGLCPNGWHVPSNAEWDLLSTSLGGESVAGDKLKSSNGWGSIDAGNNSSGFSGMPSGFRNHYQGRFYGLGSSGGWWSSTSDKEEAWYRYLFSGDANLNRDNFDQRDGFSVRCIKD